MIFCIQFNRLHLKKGGIPEELIFIRTNLNILATTIQKLEEKGLSLKRSIELVDEVADALSKLRNKDYFEKLIAVL